MKENNEKMYLVCKFYENVKADDDLDCYEVSEESMCSTLIDIKKIDLSRTSYVYHTPSGNFVNLSVE